MPTPATNIVPITIFGCNASDDAWACDISPEIDATHSAGISQNTLDAIITAKAALDANPSWESIAVASDMECQSLEAALNSSDLWRTGSEEFLVYRFGGLYLRLLQKDNRQADIEFEVVRPDGGSLIPTTAMQEPDSTAIAANQDLTLFFLSDETERPENRDLFVWASAPQDAITYWQRYYQLTSEAEPDNVWLVPLEPRPAGAIAWNNPQGLMPVTN